MDPRWVMGITLWTFLSGPIFAGFAGNNSMPRGDQHVKQVIVAENATFRNMPTGTRE